LLRYIGYNCDDAMIVRLMVVMSRSYQERALPTELCGPVCMKLYFKSIRVNSQLIMPVLL